MSTKTNTQSPPAMGGNTVQTRDTRPAVFQWLSAALILLQLFIASNLAAMAGSEHNENSYYFARATFWVITLTALELALLFLVPRILDHSCKVWATLFTLIALFLVGAPFAIWNLAQYPLGY